MFTRLYWQAHRALRVHGLFGSVRLAYDKACARPVHGPSAYDRERGVSTDGNEDVLDLTTERHDDLHLCVRYQPTADTIVREMIEVQPIDYEDATFVDLGSGKGRVLLVAAEYPFKQIVGVEFARELHEIARANLALRYPYQSARTAEFMHRLESDYPAARLLNKDATAYEFPSGPVVLFMANPFRDAIMRTVLQNAERSVRAHPRPFFVLYRQAQEAAMWDASRCFEKVASTPMFEAYRARPGIRMKNDD
jgi:SAM-dependent methyltransferase